MGSYKYFLNETEINMKLSAAFWFESGLEIVYRQ